MKRTVKTALAAAMLLCLALAGQAAAQPPPATADPADAPLSEDEAEAQAAEEESQPVAIDPAEQAPPDEFSSATIVEENGTAVAAEGNESESKNLKGELKRMLLGLLLPAVERRVREVVDSDDDHVRPGAEAEPELASEP